MKSTASCTVRIFSAFSSGISISKASSKAITSSTVSKESAPRSSTNLASGTTSSSSTPNCSAMIFFTRSSMAAIDFATSCPPLQQASHCARPLNASYHDHSAVHVQHVPRDIRRRRRDQKPHRLGHIVGSSEPAQRDLREQRRTDLPAQLVSHGRPDESRRPGVHRDPPARLPAGHCPRQPDHRRLRSRVIGLPLVAYDAAHRGDVHHGTAPLLGPCRQGGLGAVESA